MFRQTGRYSTTAGREAVWAVYTSVPAWSRWTEDIEYATLEGAFAAGRTGIVKFSRIPRARFTITAVDAPHSYALVAHLLGGALNVRFDHYLTQIPSGTQIEESADFSGILALPLGAFQRRRIRRRWPLAMREMTALAQQGYETEQSH